MRADLHIHSYYSDGLLSPEEIAKISARNGVNVIALTDHDTMLGCKSAKEECEKRGVKCVHGIEISAYLGDVKLHMLGYNPDVNCTDYKTFAAELFENSYRRAEEIIAKLNASGVRLSLKEVLMEQGAADIPVHAMHIARAGVRKGYASSAFNFYLKYLATGSVGYSNYGRPTPQKAIEVIKACGGFSSLAHPGRIDMTKPDLAALIKTLADCGLDGIECVYSTHTAVETAYYKETANTLNLVVTGGSDTHYLGGKRQIGSPEFYADGVLAEKLGI